MRPERAHAPRLDSSSRLLHFLSEIPTGRISRWVVLAVWILLLVGMSPLASKLTGAQENDLASWLPQKAESLEVDRLQSAFPQGETGSAIIVYHRDSGLTPEDLAKVEADRQAIGGLFPDKTLGPPVPSEDQKAVFFSVPMPDEFEEAVGDDVNKMRDALANQPEGLEVKVTGQAGFAADFIEIFENIDGTLLGATILVVTILLLLTYRSPFLWIIPLIAAVLANQTASGIVYGLVETTGLTVNGQSGGILPVLVFGAGTDYALLLIARYREELRRHEQPREAMAFALRRGGPAIFASGCTVMIGLLCLLVSELNSNASLGPVGAIGIFAALLAMLTFLPAILTVFGRKIFWPFIPHFGSPVHEESGLWARIGNWVAARPRPIWLTTIVILIALAGGLFAIDTNLPTDEQFTTAPEALEGQRFIAESYAAGSGAPSIVIANASAGQAVQDALRAVPGVTEITEFAQHEGKVSYQVTLDAGPASQEAFDTVERMRSAVHAVPDAEALVGGPDAQGLDVANANNRDRQVVIPLVLAVVLVILCLLLRSIAAPMMLIVTVIISFAATLGAGVLAFKYIFDFGGMDAAIPMLAFVFLVALGVDYNIFLMSRVHEEAMHIGTRAGMLKGLAVTGGVITSAGIVLAATFAVFGSMPVVFMVQLGFLVALGVLLDTIVVRSVLVPALTLDIGPKIWWPSRLAKQTAPVEQTVWGEGLRPQATSD